MGDDENIYKVRTEQLFPVGVLKIATLAAVKRSKATTPHCNPPSFRELVIKIHTSFFSKAPDAAYQPATNNYSVCLFSYDVDNYLWVFVRNV